MGNFTRAPFYLDSYSGFDTRQQRNINSLLKSFYNRLQSKSVQPTVSANTYNCKISKQNNTIRIARVTNSKDVIHLYFEFYISHIDVNSEVAFAVFEEAIPFDNPYIIAQGYVDDTLALPLRNFGRFRLDDSKQQLMFEKNKWYAEYWDSYEMQFENKRLDNTARITIDIINPDATKLLQQTGDSGTTSVSAKVPSRISHGETKQKTQLNVAIQSLNDYIDSYKADVTKQDYIDVSKNNNPGQSVSTKAVLGVVGDFVLQVGQVGSDGKIIYDNFSDGITIPTTSYRYEKNRLYEIVSYKEVEDDFDKDMGTAEETTTVDTPWGIQYTITETLHKYIRYEGWQIGQTGYNFECPFERVEKVVIRCNDIKAIGKIPTV